MKSQLDFLIKQQRRSPWNHRASFLVLGFCGLFCFAKYLLGDGHAIHFFFAALILVLYFVNSVSRKFLVIGIPLVIFAITYDFFRYIPFSYLQPIHIRDLYEFDLAHFGIWHNGGHILFHQFLSQTLSHWSLDIFCAFIYFLHVPMALILLLILWRYRSSKLAGNFAVAFLCMNLLSFATHFFYPTAAPWYIAKYGFLQPLGPIIGDAAGLVKFEDLLGTQFFSSHYQMGAITFGAVPSMHAGFAALCFLYSLKLNKKIISIMGLYLLSMCFSALYLQHHYITDIILGVLYACVVWMLINKFFVRQIDQLYSYLFRIFHVEEKTALPSVHQREKIEL